MGTAMPKPSLLDLPLGLNPPFLVANCSFPSVLAAPRAQQPLHYPLAEGAGPDVCAVTPLHQPGSEHLSAGAQSQGSGAGSTLCPQTSRAGTVVELQNKLPWAPLVGSRAVCGHSRINFFHSSLYGALFSVKKITSTLAETSTAPQPLAATSPQHLPSQYVRTADSIHGCACDNSQCGEPGQPLPALPALPATPLPRSRHCQWERSPEAAPWDETLQGLNKAHT